MQEQADCFTGLTAAFNDRILELKKYTCLRLEDGARDLFQKDLSGIDASVRALEQHVAALKQLLDSEQTTLPKVEATISAGRLQSEHLRAIANNMPTRLPGQHLRTGAATSAVGFSASDGAMHRSIQAGAGCTSTAAAPQDEARRSRKEAWKEPACPRCYITEKELASLSSYMRGRLTQEKVNAALDELVQHAENNHKLLQALKSSSSAKLAPGDRKRATELLHSVANKDGIKGNFWFLDSDLKDGTLVKLDKSGKGLLTMMRHLSRIQEMRVTVDGCTAAAYILQDVTPSA